MDSTAQLDDNFEEIIKKKAEILRNKHPSKYLEKIKLNGVLEISHYIGNLTSNSKINKHKESIFHYLNEFIYYSKRYNESDIILLRQKHLSSVINFLNREHEFYEKGILGFIVIIIGLFFDVILVIIGVAKYYYYIPVFTIIYSIQKIRKYYRLKKEGKIIDL